MKNLTRPLSRLQRQSASVSLLVALSLLAGVCGPFVSSRAQAQGPQSTPLPTPTPPKLETPTPPPPGQPPGANLPNLDVMRTLQSGVPAIIPEQHPVQGMMPICDVDCGGCTECEPPAPNDPNYGTPRTQPRNETGEPGITLASRNFNWSANLLSLPGRAGMDLNLSLTYNSLVWVQENGMIKFNADQGFPGPGFRLGFPVVQDRFQNSDTGIWSYLMITPGGGRVELRQVGSTNIYESYDGSYTQLTDNGSGNLTVLTRDGAQSSFVRVPLFNAPAVHVATQIKDRNGNYISAAYDGIRVTSITDTLGRVIAFNYENGLLMSITQDWGGPQPHRWAEFRYTDILFDYNFTHLDVDAPPDNSLLALPTSLWLDDGSHYEFTYNTWGQVYKISRFGSNGDELAYTRYNLPQDSSTPHVDCPRFTQQFQWARDWNVVNGQAIEVKTELGIDSDGGQVMIMPDGTRYKVLSSWSGWQNGLPMQSEVWSGGVRQKLTTFTWTQDNVNVGYQLNPRLIETNVLDAAGNRRRTTIDYGSYANWSLPHEVREYAANGTTPLRSTYTDYNLDPNYVNRRIIGLVSAVRVFDHAVGTYAAKTTFDYDWGGEYLVSTPQTPTNHAANHTDPTGRGNLVRVMRWDVTDINNAAKALPKTIGYNSTGSAVFARDERNHQVAISYNDSNGGNTYAYPTAATDADGFTTTSQYDYRNGLVTQIKTPPPAGFAQGPIETRIYDDARRLVRVTNNVNGAYTRWVYPTSQIVQTFATVQNEAVEAYSMQVLDGAGRVRASAADHPGSAGGYSGQHTTFDIMGRAVQQSNPTEMNSQWIALGDDAVAGWVNTSQAYDYQGRPTITTNPDNTQRILSYSACGCAGGDVMTARDERGRQRRATKDVLRRLVKVEELNWDGSVYSTANYSYNALDQLKSINHEGQVRSFGYDGYGRLQTRTTPEQGTTTFSYFADDTVQTMTDARGATTTFAYNGRHLATAISYGVPAGVAATANVSFGYDAAGNRTSMTDGLGSVTYHFDQLSRMDWEERTFAGLGTYRLSYGYNLAGQLSNITNPWGSQVGYNYDKIGRPASITGAGSASAPTYAGNFSYRAFGLKGMSYGNGQSLSLNYDNRLRLTEWSTPGVMRRQFSYGWENTGRVEFVRDPDDQTLDRWFAYDHVGRLIVSRSGTEARIAFGEQIPVAYDGPYSQAYGYDVWGNRTHIEGWGGVGRWEDRTYTNNRRSGSQYDAAGNITADGGYNFSYDATGQQATASAGGYLLQQYYDGDGLRVKKIENGATTYYLRSTVLGGQITGEMNGSGAFSRGFVYQGSSLLAVQQSNAVYWMHEDPVTKSKRVTDQNGNVVSGIELDPFGGDTNRNWNSAFQPKTFTSYHRDANGADEAMFRRYNRWWGRFDQPDPYDGSYSLADPQSFNRYAYVQNDPVNFIDPSGLDRFDTPLGPPPPPPIFVPYGGTIVTNTWASRFIGGLGIFGGGMFVPEEMPHEWPGDIGGGGDPPPIEPSQQRSVNCLTINKLLQNQPLKNALQEAWRATSRSGNENGGWVFMDGHYDDLQIYPASEGTRDSMPREHDEFRALGQRLNREAGRPVRFLLDYHTHPNGNPRPGADIWSRDTYLKRGSIGIIVSGPGQYTFYDWTGTIRPDQYNNCL